MTAKRFKLDDFDSEVEMWELMNTQAEIISDLEKENERLKKENQELKRLVKVTVKDYTDLKQSFDLIDKENEGLEQYKQSVSDVLLSWSQKNLSAKQLQVVIAIMEELNVMRGCGMTDKRFIVIDVPYENGEPFLYKKMLDKTTKKEYDNTLKGIDDMCDLANKLHKENEQLKQRNDRQAKRLGKLYELIAKKDWESLTAIIDDFKRCEEQLQREWRTYE